MKLINSNMEEIFRSEIHELEKEHKNLELLLDDNCINSLTEFARQRIKKRKLKIKDRIKQLENHLFPDLIA